MPAKDAPWKPNLYVIARFLDALARPDSTMTRGQLQAAVGVNYDVYRRYEEFLRDKAYITLGEAVRLTNEGRAVREELLSWIARFVAEGAWER